MTDPDPYRLVSASLPLRSCGTWIRVTWGEERPWNGRNLTLDEKTLAWTVATAELKKTGSHAMAAIAVHEALSERAA